MTARMLKIREPAETPAAAANNRQRARTLPTSRGLRHLLVADACNAPGVRTVALVGCGKAKLDEGAPAREMYTSTLFRKSLELAELVTPHVFVVSAAKGLLALDERITPYEVDLRSKPKEWRRDWAISVLVELANLVGTTRLRVVLLMGSVYAEPLLEALATAAKSSTRWLGAVDLLARLEIGDRLFFLNQGIKLARGVRGKR